MNHLLLYLLSREIEPILTGRRVAGIRRLDPLVVIDLRDRSGTPRYLVVVVANPGPFVWLSESDPLSGGGAPAGDYPTGARGPKGSGRKPTAGGEPVGEAIMKRINGRAITGPIEPPRNRVLRLPLDEDGDIKELALYLYGSSAKIRVQTADTIVESLDSEEAGTPVPHTFGKEMPTLIDIDESTLSAALGTSPSPARAAPGLEPELLAAFGGDVSALLTFRDALITGNESFVLATSSRLGRAAPLPGDGRSTAPPSDRTNTALTGDGTSAAPTNEGTDDGASTDLTTFGPFSSGIEASATVGSAMLPLAREALVSRTSAPLRRRLQAREKLLAKLHRDAEAAGRFETDRSEADILAAYQTQIPTGASEIELPDLYNEGETRRIELDPALPVREQIQRRYKLAAKHERGRAAIAERIVTVEKEVTAITAALDAAATGTLASGLRAVEKALVRFRIRPQNRPAARAQAVKEYRRFDLDNGWFVLVGRNDKENDEITFRVARPDDIWMHAQQTPGSHIVLKCLGKPGNPSDRILETAASIAAHYSKARHSNLVPVIFTRRKYVRKFRGARKGQVVCEREKTIFAEPKLP